MENKKTIVAIELGSSKISGAAARKNEDGVLEVLAYASLPSSSFIHYGAVHNLDRTAEGIAKIQEMLQRKLNADITQLYFGCAGRSLRTVPVTLERTLEDGDVVSSDLVDEMLSECEEYPVDNMLPLCVASQEFRTDHKAAAEQDPVGVSCSHLEGVFQKVMMRPKMWKLMDDSFSHASIRISDSMVTPLELGKLILTDEERQRGCALLDYGAETVTVSVYRSGQLAYLRVIPLGGEMITRDLMSQLQLSHDEAESLKVIYGLFGLSGSAEETASVGDRRVPLKLVGEIVEARNDEILANIAHQLKQSGCYDTLFGGIIVTGGGSNLKKLDVAMSNQFAGISPIRFCKMVPSGVEWDETQDCTITDGTKLSLLALLASGDENCCEFKEEIVDMMAEPVPENGQVFVTQDLFTDSGDSAQEERDRKKEEERAVRRAAEEQEKARRMQEGKAAIETDKPKKPSIRQMVLTRFTKFFEEVQ